MKKKAAGKKKLPQAKNPKQKKISEPGKAQKKYVDLFDNAPVGMFTFDKDTVITDVNQEGARLLKAKKDDLMNVPLMRFIEPDYSSLFKNHLSRTLSKNTKETCEISLKNKKGTLFPAHLETTCMTDKKGTVHWFRTAIMDFSKYHRAEEALKLSEAALRESKEKYRTLIDNATDGIAIIQDKTIRFANPKLCQMLEYAEEELAQTPAETLVHAEDAAQLQQRYFSFIKGKSITNPFSFKLISKSGKVLQLESRGTHIKWENQPAVLSFVRDISKQKMFEAKLKQSQKMEAIGTLAGGIAHDFNNILGSIMLNTELALDDVEKKSETEHALEQVFEASQRAKVLIEQILTFSRNAEIERIPLKINTIIKETIKMMKSMLPSTIVIKPDIPNNIRTILINPVQIQQLVVNLFTNAAHAMQEKGGILTVTLKNISLNESTAKLTGLKPGHYVKLSVSDSGKGIAPDDLDRIFDPFFTTKSTGKGTGLGLSVVHGIVSNHNGGVTVDSKLNKGTTFNVFFAIINGAASHKKKKQTSLPKGNKSILLIDDEESLLDAGNRMLKRLGYSVTVSSSGINALKLLKKQPDKYDLVITDMTMPYMTGVELTKKILDIRADIPIILCTGFNEKISPEKAKAFGIRKYIMKPYTQENMAQAVSEIF